MAPKPEAHRDRTTIKSFKQTFNAAMLILVSKPRTPKRGGTARTSAIIVIGLVLNHLFGGQIDHLITQAGGR